MSDLTLLCLYILYTVSHFSYAPFFKGPHFFTKMLESNILYDNLLNDILHLYLFDDIEKKYRIHSCESFCYAKANFDKSARLHVQSERLYFLFGFCARPYPWWSLWHKNTKNNYFIQINPLFRSLKPVTLLLFEEMLVLASYQRQLQWSNRFSFVNCLVMSRLLI